MVTLKKRPNKRELLDLGLRINAFLDVSVLPYGGLEPGALFFHPLRLFLLLLLFVLLLLLLLS